MNVSTQVGGLLPPLQLEPGPLQTNPLARNLGNFKRVETA